MPKLNRNIFKIYLYSVFEMMLFTVSILLPFFVSIGLKTSDVFLVQAVFAITVAVFEIPSGYIADLIGRKKILIISEFIAIIGFGIYSQAHGLATVVIAEMLLALSYSLYSGVKEAIMYDSLLLLEEQSTYQQKTGTAGSLGFFSEGISCIAGGLLATISLRLPFYAQLITTVIALIIILTFVEPTRSRPKQHHVENFKRALFGIFLRDKRMLWSSLLFATISSITFCSVWFSQIMYQEKNLPVAWFGILFAVGSFAVALGSIISHRLQKKMPEWAQYIMIMTIVVIGCLGMNIPAIWAVAFTLLPRMAWGILPPLSLEVANRMIDSDLRVTVLSIRNMVDRLMYVVLAPIMGYITDAYSLRTALSTSMVILVVFGGVALWKTNMAGALRKL